MTNKKCELKQFSDQMHCMTCGEVWDMNDPYPPECGEEQKTLWIRFKEWLAS